MVEIMQKKKPSFSLYRFFKHCSVLLLLSTIFSSVRAFDYADALSKSLLYFEAQRSGRLPYNQRVTWRDNSGLTDGLEQGVNSSTLFYVLFFS